MQSTTLYTGHDTQKYLIIIHGRYISGLERISSKYKSRVQDASERENWGPASCQVKDHSPAGGEGDRYTYVLLTVWGGTNLISSSSSSGISLEWTASGPQISVCRTPYFALLILKLKDIFFWRIYKSLSAYPVTYSVTYFKNVNKKNKNENLHFMKSVRHCVFQDILKCPPIKNRGELCCKSIKKRNREGTQCLW